MSLLMLAGFLGTLGAILFVGLRRSYGELATCLIGTGLLLWAVLVLAAQILSPLKLLGSTAGLVLTSLVLAVAASAALSRWPAVRGQASPTFDWPLSDRLTRLIVILLMAAGGYVALANLALAVGLLPSNPDSLVYRFPRIYWYVSQGSLMHFTTGHDPRPLFYPFNGTLLYWPLVKFGVGPRAFTLPSLTAWFATGLTTYAFAKALGGPRVAAFATAWLICLTPNPLILAISTNDEMIAAWPLLAGLFFLHRWYREHQKLDALIGFFGLALSAGTKLHIMFYWPMIIMIGVVLVWRWRATLAELRRWATPAGGLIVLLMVAIGVVFSFSFILYNLASTGRATAWEFSEQILNKPFNVLVAFQTTVLFLAQAVLTPVADLAALRRPVYSAGTYEAVNRLVAPLFDWVNNGPAYTSAFYRFTGLNSPAAFVYNEQTVFIGFTWLVGLIATCRLFAGSYGDGRIWSKLQLVALLAWIVSFAASTKYIEGFTVYLSFALVVSAPAFVHAFAPIGNRRLSQLRWALLGLVAIAHSILAYAGLHTTSGRNLNTLRRAAAWPASPGFRVDDSILFETRFAKAGIVNYSIAWGQPYWPFMAYNPRVPQYIGRYPIDPSLPIGGADDWARRRDRLLHIFTFPQTPMWGRAAPVRVADRSTAGFTLIGSLDFALGPEWVFATGNGVASRFPGRDKYVVQRFEELSDFGHATEALIALSSTVYGLDPGDEFSFRYELSIDGSMIYSTGWAGAPATQIKAPGLGKDNGVLTFHVRNDKTGSVYSTALPLRSTKPLSVDQRAADQPLGFR